VPLAPLPLHMQAVESDSGLVQLPSLRALHTGHTRGQQQRRRIAAIAAPSNTCWGVERGRREGKSGCEEHLLARRISLTYATIGVELALSIPRPYCLAAGLCEVAL
jgi:hypothetical protein